MGRTRFFCSKFRFRTEHQDSDIQGTSKLKLNQICRFQVGAVGEPGAIGVEGLLRLAIEEDFPFRVGVRDIDIEDKTGSYTYKKKKSVRIQMCV